jgi:hypothetical protein
LSSFQALAIVEAADPLDDVDYQIRPLIKAGTGITIFSLLVSLILSGLLLYGANKYKRSFLLPWLVIEMLHIILYGLSLLVFFILYCADSIITWYILFFLVPGALLGLKIYFW